jgi:nucleotide-binding universal stress UspA family protein
MTRTARILMAYDGSPDADAAIERITELMPGGDLTVLSVWEPFIDEALRTGSAGVGAMVPFAGDADIDEATREAALQSASVAAQRATAAGLHASPRIASGHGGVARAILKVAGELDADLVVLGTRGRGGVTSFLLGSVSHAVVQHADRAVLIVPSAELVERRHGWAEPADAAAAVEAT